MMKKKIRAAVLPAPGSTTPTISSQMRVNKLTHDMIGISVRVIFFYPIFRLSSEHKGGPAYAAAAATYEYDDQD